MQAEALGNEGKINESIELTKSVDEMKRKKRELEVILLHYISNAKYLLKSYNSIMIILFNFKAEMRTSTQVQQRLVSLF